MITMMKRIVPWVFAAFFLIQGMAYAAEVSNIDVRNIRITTSDRMDVYASFRTATDEPTIQLSSEKLTAKIDDVPVPANDLKVKSFVDSEQGIAVLIALDISGSMTHSLPTLKQELKKYIKRLRPAKDFVAIGIIGDNWKLALDFTSDIDQASAFIDQLQGASQTTALFESIYDGVRLLSRKGSDIPVRRSMIVLSDGMNEKAGRTAAQCIDLAKQSFIDVHSLIFLPSQNARVLAAKGELEVISKDTGGVTFTALTAEQIGTGVDILSQEMANEILLSIPLQIIPANGLNHTLGLSYDNFSKKTPFVISESELARIKSSSSSAKADYFREKIWLYLGLGIAALILIGLFFWRRAVNKRASLLAQQAAAAAAQADNPIEPSEANHRNVMDFNPAADRAVEESKPRPAARKTEYRAPGGDRAVSRLVLIRGDSKEQTFLLDDAQIFIGANDNNDIWLDIPSVSGRHAVLTKTATGYAITDLNSTNGTYINGHRIQQGAVDLHYGQEIRLGVVVFRAE